MSVFDPLRTLAVSYSETHNASMSSRAATWRDRSHATMQKCSHGLSEPWKELSISRLKWADESQRDASILRRSLGREAASSNERIGFGSPSHDVMKERAS